MPNPEHLHRIDTYRDDAHRQHVIDLWTVAFGRGAGHNDPDLSIDKKLAVQDGLFFVALGDGRGGPGQHVREDYARKFR